MVVHVKEKKKLTFFFPHSVNSCHVENVVINLYEEFV